MRIYYYLSIKIKYDALTWTHSSDDCFKTMKYEKRMNAIEEFRTNSRFGRGKNYNEVHYLKRFRKMYDKTSSRNERKKIEKKNLRNTNRVTPKTFEPLFCTNNRNNRWNVSVSTNAPAMKICLNYCQHRHNNNNNHTSNSSNRKSPNADVIVEWRHSPPTTKCHYIRLEWFAYIDLSPLATTISDNFNILNMYSRIVLMAKAKNMESCHTIWLLNSASFSVTAAPLYCKRMGSRDVSQPKRIDVGLYVSFQRVIIAMNRWIMFAIKITSFFYQSHCHERSLGHESRYR